jgi:hypothetical protein
MTLVFYFFLYIFPSFPIGLIHPDPYSLRKRRRTLSLSRS